MKLMSYVLTGVAACIASAIGTGSAMGTEPLKAQEILKKAAEATKALKSVRYAFQRQGTGADEERIPKMNGTAWLGGWRYNAVEKYRVDMTVRRPGAEPTQVVAGCDGNVVYLVDAAEKKVFADMDPAVLGKQAGLVRAAILGEFLNPDAFGEALKSEVIELVGVVKVGDVDCHQIRTRGNSAERETVWYIAQKDFLPRRLELVFPNQDGKSAGRRMDLIELTVNPRLEADPSVLKVPDGYTKTDDFAP